MNRIHKTRRDRKVIPCRTWILRIAVAVALPLAIWRPLQASDGFSSRAAERPQAKGLQVEGFEPARAVAKLPPADRAETVPAGPQLNGPPLIPQTNNVATLNGLTQLALDNNPILQRARARIESARGTAWQAGIWTNPRWDTNNPYVIASPGQAYNAGFAQLIPSKGKKRLDRAAALQQVREATFSAWSDRYDVLQAVRQQFYALLVQQQRVRGLSEVLETATRARDAAQRLYENGQVAETDVLALSVVMNEADAELRQARTLLVSKRRQLAAAIGIPELPIAEVTGDLNRRPPPFDDLFVRQFVAAQNVDVQSAQAELRRANILLTRAEVEPYPNLYTGPAAQWGPNHANQFWWNVQFLIPAWDLNQGGIGVARWYIRGASADIRITQNRLIKQAADALGRHRAALQLAETMRTEVLPVARRNFELVRRGYPSIIPVFQLLQAQRALFEANLSYLDALEEVWTSAAELGNLLQLEQFP